MAGGGGVRYSLIWVIWVCAAPKGMVFSRPLHSQSLFGCKGTLFFTAFSIV